MVKTFLLICLVLLAISGICELIHSLRLIFLRPACRNGALCVIWLKKGCAAQQLGFTCEQLRWWGSDFAEHIIAISSDIDGEELEECQKIAERSAVTLCPAQVVENVIESISANFI